MGIKLFLVAQLSFICCKGQNAIFNAANGKVIANIKEDVKKYLSEDDRKKFNDGDYVTVYKDVDEGNNTHSIDVNKEGKMRLYVSYGGSVVAMKDLMNELCGGAELAYDYGTGKNDAGADYVGGKCKPKIKTIKVEIPKEERIKTKCLKELKKYLTDCDGTQYYKFFEQQVKRCISDKVGKLIGEFPIVTFESSDELLMIKMKGFDDLDNKLREKLYKRSHKYKLITEPIEIEGESEPNIILPGLENINGLKEFESNSYKKITYNVIVDEVTEHIKNAINDVYKDYEWNGKKPEIIFYRKNKESQKFEKIDNGEEIETKYILYYVVKDLLIDTSKHKQVTDLIGETEKFEKYNKDEVDIDKIDDIAELGELKRNMSDGIALLRPKIQAILGLRENEIISPFYKKAECLYGKFKYFIGYIDKLILQIKTNKCMEEQIKPAVVEYVKKLEGDIKSATKDNIYDLVKDYIDDESYIRGEWLKYGKGKEEIKLIAIKIYKEKILKDKFINKPEKTEEYELQQSCIAEIGRFYSDRDYPLSILKLPVVNKLRELGISNFDELKGTSKEEKKAADDKKKQIEREELKKKELERKELEKVAKTAEENAKKLEKEANKRKEELKLLKDKEKAIDEKIKKISKKTDGGTKKGDETGKDIKTKPSVDTNAHTVGGCCSCCKCCKKRT